ncbi:putative flippase GtrA [Sphingomonas jejuensis]|uniref:Flippase GtrA n=1 Tax=Sphingomonas jejuensis TaxID=904715 RepID=A0ABX0XP39_9SPHN|nr:GtrA family protein [Sphingomonas jejuensis]NJC34995.1 putative flippase GtrA [Sphingomonas jejuensis]
MGIAIGQAATRGTLGQIVRYGITGGLVTIGFSAVYWLLATPVGLDSQVALTIAFLLWSGIGFVLHGRISFRDHGSRDRMGARSVRFLLVNLLGFALNQLFVWVLVKQMGGPTWWPILPFIFVTPLVTFVLHRRWVYA